MVIGACGKRADRHQRVHVRRQTKQRRNTLPVKADAVERLALVEKVRVNTRAIVQSFRDGELSCIFYETNIAIAKYPQTSTFDTFVCKTRFYMV